MQNTNNQKFLKRQSQVIYHVVADKENFVQIKRWSPIDQVGCNANATPL